jgi:hypothetical protein
MSFRHFDPHQGSVPYTPAAPSDQSGIPHETSSYLYGESQIPSPHEGPPLSDPHGSVPIHFPHSTENLGGQVTQDWTSSPFPQASLHHPMTQGSDSMGSEGYSPRQFAFYGGPKSAGESLAHPPHERSTSKIREGKKELFTFPDSLIVRRFIGPLMAFTGLLIAGFIGYALLKKGGKRGTSQPPPIIEADGKPVKVAPQDEVSTDEPNKQDMRIYDKISSKSIEQDSPLLPSKDSLLRKEEIPVINPVQQLSAQDLRGGEDEGETFLGFPPPKRVKTVIMTPDGTIVSQKLTAENSKKSSSEESKTVAELSEDLQDNAKIRESSQTIPDIKKAISPQNKQSISSAQLPEVVTDTPLNGGRGFSIQLAAAGSEKEALTAFETFKRRYRVLEGKEPFVYKVSIAGKTVYRLRVKTSSPEASSNLCKSIQGQGGSCFVARN